VSSHLEGNVLKGDSERGGARRFALSLSSLKKSGLVVGKVEGAQVGRRHSTGGE